MCAYYMRRQILLALNWIPFRLKETSSEQGKCLLLYNHGENNARGTMFASKPHIKPFIHNTIPDDQGRNIILDCTIFEHWFTFVNIYGPNIDQQASLFYEHVFSEIYASPNDTKIIAGDFNLVLDPDKDKLGGNVELHKASRQIVLNNMENYDLMDIWQNMHPEEKQFTFFKIRPPKVFSCLDFFLVSSDLIGLTKECSIIPGFKTDHSSVEFSLVFFWYLFIWYSAILYMFQMCFTLYMRYWFWPTCCI